MDVEPRFLDPHGEILRRTNRLPHWQQQDTTYFVTIRLADSLPASLLQQWQEEREAWMRWNPKPWSPKQDKEYRLRFTGTIERWLDAGHGSCLFRRPVVAHLIGTALGYFDGVRYRFHSWVVMPNHAHLLFSLLEGTRLEAQIQSWKGFTARAINRELGRTGSLWQKDYHDRMVRNGKHFVNCARYIRSNPTTASLRQNEFLHFESKFVREMLDAEEGG